MLALRPCRSNHIQHPKVPNVSSFMVSARAVADTLIPGCCRGNAGEGMLLQSRDWRYELVRPSATPDFEQGINYTMGSR